MIKVSIKLDKRRRLNSGKFPLKFKVARKDRFRKAFLRLFLLNIAVDSLMSIKIAVEKACEKKKSSNSLHM